MKLLVNNYCYYEAELKGRFTRYDDICWLCQHSAETTHNHYGSIIDQWFIQ